MSKLSVSSTSFGNMNFFAPLGSGTGGSANLYAAQLERMLPIDFSPKKNDKVLIKDFFAK